ncbi:tetratricopeptide repeat protein [Flagellimonas sp.]|uniref:tetratricopeptide repeat protein n=1 Tax=Flagellimonas sp. TaxID=2058762 RepID=UPI003BB0DB05
MRGFFNNLFRGKQSVSLEEACQKNQENLSRAKATDEEEILVWQASNALTSGEFEEAVQRYLELAIKYPWNKGLYLSQVGAGYYFLTEFDKAIAYYLEAKQVGMDAAMMDDSVWETCETQYNNTHNKTDIKKYLEYFPEGSHIKKAQKLLNG